MRNAWWLSLVLTIALSLTACGKKGPPRLPAASAALRVERLEASWDGQRAKLTAEAGRGRGGAAGEPAGCRVYHLRYAADSPPCETCPLEFGAHRDVQGAREEGNRFVCWVEGLAEPGLHYFRVRLLDRGGRAGPPSGTTRLVKE